MTYFVIGIIVGGILIIGFVGYKLIKIFNKFWNSFK